MRCCKCLQSCGQMMCFECYKTIKMLNEQKKNVIVSKQLSFNQQLDSLKVLRQSFVRKLQIKKRKRVLLAKITQLKSKNRTTLQRSKEMITKSSVLQCQIQRIEKQLKIIEIRKLQLEEQILKTKNRVDRIRAEKERLKGQIINIMHSKFKEIINYISFDQVQPLEESNWIHFVQEEGLENLQTSNLQLSQLPTQSTNIVSILGDIDKSKRTMARHFQKSIKVIKILAHLHDVKLPYNIRAGQFKSKISLRSALFNQANGKMFNYSLLKKHQVNTIYLYSRACMTVFHPDIEQGRLQELHEAMVNRLRGYSLRPISFQIRKAGSMSQLSTESLIKNQESHIPDKEQQQNNDSAYLGIFELKGEAQGQDENEDEYEDPIDEGKDEDVIQILM